MVINNFKIDTSTLAGEEVTRTFIVSGEVGAQFKIIALQNPGSSSAHTLYYDFSNRAFESGHNNSSNDLIVTLSSNVYNDGITFPSGSGEFVIKLIAINSTTIQNSKTPVLTRSISKIAANPVITFSPGTTNSSTYSTFPTITVTGSPGSSPGTSNFNWDITNVSTDGNGFGLRIPAGPIGDINYTMGDWENQSWYFETTEAVADNPLGDGEDSTTVTVSDITDIAEGMILQFHKGTTVPTNKAGSAVGETFVKGIDTDTKTITFSPAVAFEDGETMTFRAYGFTNIYSAIGLQLLMVNWRAFPNTTVGDEAVDVQSVTKTVRSGGSGTTINLNGTYGISGGGHVSVFGVGVDNSSANTVQSVSASSSAGSVVVQVSQSLTVGTTLQFVGSVSSINFTGTIEVGNIQETNRTIFFDLDKYITPGTAS